MKRLTESWKTADRGKADEEQEEFTYGETADRVVQYIMTACLLGMAFVLPGLGMRMQSAQSQDRPASVQESGRTSEQSGQSAAVQGGNIVQKSLATEQGENIAQKSAAAEQGENTMQESAVQQGENAMQESAVQQGENASQEPAAAGQGENAAQESQAEEQNGNTAQDAASESREKGKIVLDAGHGGDDPGMIGASGINERVLNLVYAKKLEALLTEKGYQVVMTRPTEDGLYDADEPNKKAQDMQRRCAIIEEEQPLVTVSIHQNSYPDSSVSGPQVFYYEHSAEGERLAASIQNSMNEQLAIARPRVQKGNTSYYILKRSASVTVIVECGFLSNPQEEAKLQEEAYQDQVAQAVCDGIVRYLEEGSDASGN